MMDIGYDVPVQGIHQDGPETQYKALGLNNNPEDPNRIFPRPSKDLSKFQTRAKEIVSNVVKLKEF
jgi:hypothetical protein